MISAALLQQLPALQIALPLTAAPICFLLRRPGLAWAWATAISWLCLAVSAALLWQVLEGGIIRYPLGGWPVPLGIEYRIDIVNAFLLLLVSAMAAIVLPYARLSIAAELPTAREPLLYALWLLLLTGLLGISITGDAFNVFVSMEIASLASYGLVASGRDRRALLAAFRYLIIGTIGGTFVLVGIGLLYLATGTLNMVDLAERLPDAGADRAVAAAAVFVIVGLGIKLAMFPLHQWLPNAYRYAPSAVTAFMASTGTKVAVYGLLRFVFTIFGGRPLIGGVPLADFLALVAVLGMLLASLVAVYQDDIKRMLAFSSVAQIGYILLGMSLLSVGGVTAALVHLFNHALIKGGLFLCIGCIAYRQVDMRLPALAGLGQRMPWTMAAFVLGGLSLIGVPLTSGFISKWYLLNATIANGAWLLTSVVVISSLLAVIYIWRVVEVAYFREPGKNLDEVREAPLSLLLPTWILLLANVGFGINSGFVAGTARMAADQLLGVPAP